MPPIAITKLLAWMLVLSGPAVLAAQVHAGDDGRAATAVRDGTVGDAAGQRNAAPASFQAPAAAAPSSHDTSLPLAPRRRGKTAEGGSQPDRAGGLSSVLTIGSGLALVLGLFCVVAWMLRRASPRSAAMLPSEVFEVLGRAPLAGRQQVQLLRCGNRLLLVCVTPEGAETLTEIADPDEVTRLAGLCRQAHPNSATAAFRQVFQQLAAPAKAARYREPGGREDLRLAKVGVPPTIEAGLEDRDG